ncbi:hypothetical protein FS749_016194 [Ceratobasidium sp. UAMH 11750]|nr:hypothetical protein FS749_016194 [Ceratobasidium sp. UAMH 11750]
MLLAQACTSNESGSDCTRRNQANPGLFGSLTGHEQGGGPMIFSPSPPNTGSPDDLEPAAECGPEQVLKFGIHARKDDIDDG